MDALDENKAGNNLSNTAIPHIQRQRDFDMRDVLCIRA